MSHVAASASSFTLSDLVKSVMQTVGAELRIGRAKTLAYKLEYSLSPGWYFRLTPSELFDLIEESAL